LIATGEQAMQALSWRSFDLGLVLMVAAGFTSQAAAIPANAILQGIHADAQATRVERPPRLDGTLNDPLWQSAAPITGFRQREPHEGQAPTEQTEVRILYTSGAIYFGIRCHDSSPSRIAASELRRDVDQGLDDHFEIMIDSTLDRRGAYVFQVNPLGTQMDGLIVEEQGEASPNGEPASINNQGDFDPAWDGVWRSEARISADGWTATVEIPFNTLNFRHTKEILWGLNFKRFIRRKNEEDLWRAYQRTYGLTKVSQAAVLGGIRDIDSGRLLVVKPYALLQYDKLASQRAGSPLTGGMDVKYGLSPDTIFDLTVNTDFADTDVDLEPFNITPFRVFIPEKRPFFLEDAGVFSFDLGDQDQLFFSRQIGIDPVTGQEVPINAGGKLTGTFGRTEMGVLYVDTRSSGPNPSASYTVLRVKESLWGGSYVGMMGIEKRANDALDSFNQTGGIDTRLAFLDDWYLTAHAARTRAPGDPKGSSDVGATLNYQSDWLEGTVERRRTGANFNPEVGFVQRVDSNETYVDLNFKMRPRLPGIRELQAEGFILDAPSTAGSVSTQEWQNSYRAYFDNGGYTDDDLVDVTTQRLAEPLHIYRNVFIPSGLYRFIRHQLSYGSGKDKPFTFEALERFGSYYDGSLNEVSLRANYRVSTRASASASATWDRFALPLLNGHFSVELASLQANYSFSRFITFSSVLQMNTSDSQAVSANLRLRYNYRPDSDLFFIYNVGTQFASTEPANPPQLRETRVAVKWTYSFSP